MPPATGPAPKPVPPIAAHVPMAPALIPGGYVSVMMASASAESAAPPTPCAARNAINAAPEVARAQAADARAKTVSPRTNTRLRP